MKIDNPELLGQVMRERRKSLGFTIEQMAQAVGVAPITIMRLELGRLSYVHNRTARLLEVPAKVVKRMVMVAAPADAAGRILPTSTLANSPSAETRELARATNVDRAREITSGDAQTVNPMPIYQQRQRRARSAKLEGKNAKLEDRRDSNVERHGQAHIASPLRKLFLWMAARV